MNVNLYIRGCRLQSGGQGVIGGGGGGDSKGSLGMFLKRILFDKIIPGLPLVLQ